MVLIYSPEIAPCNRLGWLRKMCSPTGVNGNAHSARLLTGYEFISKEEPCFFSSRGPSVLCKYIFESKEGNLDNFSSLRSSQPTFIRTRRASSVTR